MNRLLVCAALAAASTTISAQEKRAVIVEKGQFDTVVDPVTAGAMSNTFHYVSVEAGLSPKLVKGAPYSATAVTETVQTLADGNRITHATNATVVRDSQGRTRREQSFPALGPWASDGAAPKMTTINDPVAGVTYMVDDREKTVRKLQSKVILDNATSARARSQSAVIAGSQVHVETMPGAPAGGGNVMFYRHSTSAPIRTEPPKVENLGQKTIEGVVADGTRTTAEIPAGAEGNERPIQIVDERWYSNELQTTVMSRHSDPRSGETTFRLTNVSRAEPSPALFEVPADYKVVEGPGSPMEIRIQRKEKE